MRFGPAYNLEFLKEVLKLQQQIHTIGHNESIGLDKICFAPMTYEGQQPTLDQCTVQSIFGFFGNNVEELEDEGDDGQGYVDNYLDKINKCLS